jgi:hypothetical protein
MHTFGVILVLLLEQHAFFHTHQSFHNPYYDRQQSSWTSISLSACRGWVGAGCRRQQRDSRVDDSEVAAAADRSKE